MNFPFFDIAKSVFGSALEVIWNPALGVRFLFYWMKVFIVFSQYRKTAVMQTRLFGNPRRSPLNLTLVAGLEGLAVGLAGSYIMTFVGVSFLPDGGGLIWVLGTAVLLMLINPRFMCFSYAGGLISVIYLIFGVPKVSVPSLMGLVAVLHLMESLLIFLNGSAGATPVYLEQGGRQVGAFYLQRSWPVPVALLILAVVSPLEAAGGVGMPDWWPLFRSAPEILAHPGAIFFLNALPAALGYSDLAVTCPPEAKARYTARYLAIYSVSLLILAVEATRYPVLIWPTALFAPLAHEGVVRLGNRRERLGQPEFVPSARGVKVLSANPGSPAERVGLGAGWVITAVNGNRVDGRQQLDLELLQAVGPAPGSSVSVALDTVPPPWAKRTARAGGTTRVTLTGPDYRLGILPVPEPGDDMGLTLTTASPARNLLRRIFGGRRRN